MPLIRFYEELNDYLTEDKRKQDICISTHGVCTVRTILSSLNVPIDEVDLILVNGQSEGADYAINENDRISIYPVFERFNIENVSRVRIRALRRPRFITDAGLIDLVDQLSALGLDVICHNSSVKSELIQQSNREKRIILTLDREFAEHEVVTRVIVLTARTTDAQVAEIWQHLDL